MSEQNAKTDEFPAVSRPTAGRGNGGMSGSTSRVKYRPAAQLEVERLSLTRGLGHLGMTLVLPGSAQIASGNKRIGQLAMRGWAVIVICVVLWLLTLLINPGAAIAIVTFKPLTVLIAATMAVAGVAWAALMLNAWKLANPVALARRHRPVFGVLAGTLALALGGGMIASAGAVNTQGDFLGTVFAGGGDSQVKDGRYNILIMGGDGGEDRYGLRPDSMTVASVDARTGQTVLFSLPRNLEEVEFPDDSPMKELYPKKFSCPDHQCLLNAVYTKAQPELYPGVKNPGAQATIEAIEWTTGLDINYYVLTDLNGFKALVDAVGGIHLDVNKRVPVGGGSTEVGRYIEPGKGVHMDGHNALWFARSRHNSSDYERMERQKCVMNAMLNQLDPLTVITKSQDIAAAGKEVVETNIPTSEMDRLAALAMKARDTHIRSVSFVPPLIFPGDPDFDLIRSTVAERIDESEGRTPEPAPGPEEQSGPVEPVETRAVPVAQTSSAPTPTKTPTRKTTRSASPEPSASSEPSATPVPEAQGTDLSAVCSAA